MPMRMTLSRVAPAARDAAPLDVGSYAPPSATALPGLVADCRPPLPRPLVWSGWWQRHGAEDGACARSTVASRQSGSTARHFSDLGNLDVNWFVLLGGQDGWAGSTTMADEVALWRRGEYILVPLRVETVRERFPFLTELHP